jgi:hypothetical protein
MKVAVIVNKTTRELVSVIEPVYVGKGPRFFAIDSNYHAFEMELEELMGRIKLNRVDIWNISRYEVLDYFLDANSGGLKEFEQDLEDISTIEAEAPR